MPVTKGRLAGVSQRTWQGEIHYRWQVVEEIATDAGSEVRIVEGELRPDQLAAFRDAAGQVVEVAYAERLYVTKRGEPQVARRATAIMRAGAK